ncbi:flavodoxin domain-containing protein [Corynebacterium freiburgense]|uniref:flavodoxin domain-containing protein n=1 Tax=Corynebacterium freiburgense TaxID=556548 RepID=UPI00041000AF|nr:flavodoxin domain-containing protein [Corynebacterium freiburgense]WJZ02189.1 Flavodoxin domain protein [Corynebacterium freiburgense]
MISPHILVESVYGSTQQYADELAKRTGGRIRALENTETLETELASAPAPLIICSPNYGPVNKGVSWVKENPQLVRAYASALVVVGMSLPDYAKTRDAAGTALGNLAADVPRFYLPGRLTHSQLSTKHRSVLWSVNQMIKRKPSPNENDRNMIAEYGKDIDHVNFTHLEPVVNWWRSLTLERV